MDHLMDLDFAALLEPAAMMPSSMPMATATARWSVRDVYAAADLGTLRGLTRTVGAHDCILLILTPASS